jgi:hypothetical protein
MESAAKFDRLNRPLNHPRHNLDEPESNTCMTSSQKIEVGHTLKSKNAPAFLLFKPSGTNIGHHSPLFEQTLGRNFPKLTYVQLQFFGHLAHDFTPKRIIIPGCARNSTKKPGKS